MKDTEEETTVSLITLEKEVERLRLKTVEHDTSLKYLNPSIDRIDATLLRFFEIYALTERRFDRLETILLSHSQRFEAIDQRFEAIDQRFDSIEATLALVLEAVRPSSAGGASVN